MQELRMFPSQHGNHVYLLGVTKTFELVAKEMNALNINIYWNSKGIQCSVYEAISSTDIHFI